MSHALCSCNPATDFDGYQDMADSTMRLVNIFIFLVFCFSSTACLSSNGTPSADELNKAPVIVAGKVSQFIGSNCLIGHAEFIAKGEISKDFLYCAMDTYVLEPHISNTSLAQGNEQYDSVIFFLKKDEKLYTPAFHSASTAFLNKEKCVIFPGIFDDKKNFDILEPSQVFFDRLKIKMPKRMKSNSACNPPW